MSVEDSDKEDIEEEYEEAEVDYQEELLSAIVLSFYLRGYSAYFVLNASVTICLHYQTLNFVLGFYKVIIKWFFYYSDFLIKCTF